MKARFVHTLTNTSFIENKQNNLITSNDICFIKDSNRIATHDRIYNYVKWDILESPDTEHTINTIAGDIVLYNTQDEQIYFVSANKLTKSYTASHIPIGVVVVPGTHDVYGDGSCGVMSLKSMDFNNPTQGGDDTPMYWGPQVDIPIFGYTKVVIYAADGSLSTNNFGYLSKDGSYNYGSAHIPDPYLQDGSRNPDYYISSGITNANYNALSDFAGKSNTNQILAKRGVKNYTSWTPSNTTSDYPAASCCDMYFTPGTEQQTWYLPSCGELSYVMAKWSTIQNSLDLINTVFGSNYANRVGDNDGYWCSTENATKNARYVHTGNGVGYSNKDTTYKVRAFIKLYK